MTRVDPDHVTDPDGQILSFDVGVLTAKFKWLQNRWRDPAQIRHEARELSGTGNGMRVGRVGVTCRAWRGRKRTPPRISAYTLLPNLKFREQIFVKPPAQTESREDPEAMSSDRPWTSTTTRVGLMSWVRIRIRLDLIKDGRNLDLNALFL
jgi:hypothetical protein